ncbi:hypothetical protein HAX54_049750, partial [Datura stramonium]|nr:hypothetical protein [Datura stramonium]
MSSLTALKKNYENAIHREKEVKEVILRTRGDLKKAKEKKEILKRQIEDLKIEITHIKHEEERLKHDEIKYKESYEIQNPRCKNMTPDWRQLKKSKWRLSGSRMKLSEGLNPLLNAYFNTYAPHHKL